MIKILDHIYGGIKYDTFKQNRKAHLHLASLVFFEYKTQVL